MRVGEEMGKQNRGEEHDNKTCAARICTDRSNAA